MLSEAILAPVPQTSTCGLSRNGTILSVPAQVLKTSTRITPHFRLHHSSLLVQNVSNFVVQLKVGKSPIWRSSHICCSDRQWTRLFSWTTSQELDIDLLSSWHGPSPVLTFLTCPQASSVVCGGYNRLLDRPPFSQRVRSLLQRGTCNLRA